MLILVNALTKDRRTYVKAVVLNTEFLGEITEVSTGAMFKYYSRTEDRRGGVTWYTVSQTSLAIQNWMDTDLADNHLNVGVYVDDDFSSTPVNTIWNQDEVVLIVPYAESPLDTSWLYINEKGWKVRRYLVDQFFIDFVDIAETGSSSTTTSTSTSTTSTSTTSTSTTSTTSTSTTSTSSTSTTSTSTTTT